MKTVLFVPGSGEDIKSRDYPAVISAIKKRGYNVKFVSITWSRTTIDDWVQELDAEYEKRDPKETILAGFSWGAMTAFMSATKRNPSELWLFSLSPYFAADLKSKNMKKSWLTEIGHRRVSAFEKLDFPKLAKTINNKTLLFYGSLEPSKFAIMDERMKDADKHLKNHTLIMADGAGHDVADERYVRAIARYI